MSIDLYWRRLVWNKGRGGIAKEGDLVLTLHSAPPVFPNVVELDIGEVRRGEFSYDPVIRDADCECRRDITPPEVVAFRLWMASLLDAVMRKARVPPDVKEDRRR